MKLSGNKSTSKHEKRPGKHAKSDNSRVKRAIIATAMAFALTAVIAGAVWRFVDSSKSTAAEADNKTTPDYVQGEKGDPLSIINDLQKELPGEKTPLMPPENTAGQNEAGETGENEPEMLSGDTETEIPEQDKQGTDEPSEYRPVSGENFRDGVYTFAVLGRDKVSGGTDTMMVVTFDTVNYTVGVVSIPRDTLVNVSWSTKKANTLYSVGGESGLKAGLKELLGYDIQYYILVNLNAFQKLVDAVGGVSFDVPQKMDYDDPAQDLHIHLKAGLQTLNGKDAMGLVRFRRYSAGDIRRIEVQQDFMKAAISDIKSKLSWTDILTVADIFINDVTTDLSISDLIFFADRAMKTDLENVTFSTMPGNYGDSFHGSSYVTVYVDDWLTMINDILNPTDRDITAENVSIVTRGADKKLYMTSGKARFSLSWGR